MILILVKWFIILRSCVFLFFVFSFGFVFCFSGVWFSLASVAFVFFWHRQAVRSPLVVSSLLFLNGASSRRLGFIRKLNKDSFALGIQIPSKKVVIIGAFRRLNTF